MYNLLYSYTLCTSDPLFSTCTSERRVACHVNWCVLNCVDNVYICAEYYVCTKHKLKPLIINTHNITENLSIKDTSQSSQTIFSSHYHYILNLPKRATSQQGTKEAVPKCPLFGVFCISPWLIIHCLYNIFK